MKSLWLILLVAFGLLPTLLASAKKAAMRGVGADDDSEESRVDGAGEDDGFFNFDDVEPEKTVTRQQPSYFTYEAPDVEVPPVRPTAAAQAETRRVEAEQQPVAPAFDLRQAVIYQTLLNNKYINAEN